MAINENLIHEMREALEAELPQHHRGYLLEFDSELATPNYRGAFAVLMEITQLRDWRPSEKLNQLIGKFWHEVAE